MGNSLRKPRKSLQENQQEQEDEDESSGFTCEICIEPASPGKKFKNAALCKHPFCQDCIAKYIEVKVQDNASKIECPEPNCQHHLDPITCRPMVPPPLFSSWCDLLCEDCLLGSKKSYCPNRDCRALVLNECGGNVKKSRCPNCKKLFCFECQTAWHAGYRCEEREEVKDRNDVLFGELLERNKWIKCPGCGQCVERLQGCSVVKCRCNTRFCYQCGEKITMSGRCGCKNFSLRIVLFNYIAGLVALSFVILVWLSIFSEAKYTRHLP